LTSLIVLEGPLRTARRRLSPEVALLVVVFVVSRAITLLLGFRYETGGINGAVQAVDPSLLRAHLLQSIWYLHSQPPLWNLAVGLTLHLLPAHWPQVWHGAFFALGLIETLALYALLLGFGLGRRTAAVLTAGVMLSPSLLVYESDFAYDYPTLVLITLTVLGVQRLVARPTFFRGLAVFSAAASLVLLRTLFQIGWLILLIALVAVAVPRRRSIFASAAIPLLVVSGVYVKNWVLFGVPSTSSWEGMALARIAEHGYSLRDRQQLVAEGALHRVSLVTPLSALGAYRRAGAAPAAAKTGIPVLDEVAGKEYPRNLHNKAYIKISNAYWHDDLWLIRHHPLHYARSTAAATAIFFWPPAHGGAFGPNASRMRAYERWFRRIAYGAASERSAGIILIAAYAIAVLGGALLSARFLRQGCNGAIVASAAATFTIVYTMAVGNLSELGENYRFRLVLDPMAIALLAYVVAFAVDLYRSHVNARSIPRLAPQLTRQAPTP
jgi:hypothetical protein